MGLRIRTNVSAATASRFLGNTTEAVRTNTERLSSGYRINKSADDAAGLAISDALNAKVRSMEQAKRNANDGVSMVQVAEGSMSEITNILTRLRELATQSASDTVGNLERSYTNKEYISLVEEINRISNTAEFNGLFLLKGSMYEKNKALGESGILTIHVGAGDGAIENTDTINININDLKIDGLTDLNLFAGEESPTPSAVGPYVLTKEGVGADFSRATAAQKLGIIDDAIKKVAGNRSILGSKQSRLASAINNLGVQIENLSTSKSRIKDVDFATETALFTQNRILGQAGASVLAQANSIPNLALGLLQG
ncbi:MAG: flagellin FliC [Oligoflexales bacterium]|nr:flagellin FliC [Oligoflexales bacterium]